jgi:hypothetical protein
LTTNADKTFFLPPKEKSEKPKASWKEPYPDRMGNSVNGTWIIPNETTTVNTTFSKVNESSSKTETSIETNKSAKESNVTVDKNTSKSSNVSIEANVTASLLQISEDDTTEPSEEAPKTPAGGRPAISSGFYDAEGNYFPPVN